MPRLTPHPVLCAIALISAFPSHGTPTYVDATPANTTLADGTPLSLQTTVNSDDPPEFYLQRGDAEVANNHWQIRTGFGNGGGIFASHANSDSPMLRTTISGLTANETYEIAVCFWVAGNGTPVGNQEWDIRAGLSPDALTNIRHNTAGVVRLDTSAVTFSNSVMVIEADRRLFKYVVGTAAADDEGNLRVYVDDFPGNDDRTWYDGLAFTSLAPPEPAVWVGNGQGGAWSDPANWLAGSPPVVGDALVFGEAGGFDTANDLPADRSYSGLRFPPEAEFYEFTGNRLSLDGPLVNQSVANQLFELDFLLQGDLDVNVLAGAVFLDGELSGAGGLNKSGPGLLELTAANRHTGHTTVISGPLGVLGNHELATGGWSVGPGTAAATTVSFFENSVVRVAPQHAIRVGDNKGSFASSLASQTLRVLGEVKNDGELETGLQAFISLEGGSRWEQHGPMAIRGYNNWNSRLTVQADAVFHHLGNAPITLRAGTGATGRGRIVLAGGVLVTGSGFSNENPDGALRPLVELREDGVLRVSGPVTELTDGIEVVLGSATGVIDTAGHAVTASGPLSGPGTLAKEGAGTLSLKAGTLHAGGTIVREGRLVISEPSLSDLASVEIATGAVLELDHDGQDMIAALVIGGVALAPGIWGSPSSDAPNTDPALAGTGKLVVPVNDPFGEWINGFTSLTLPADKEKSADPDHDGLNNLGEFALDGDPTSPAASGKVRGHLSELSGGTAFTLTLPVRDGAVTDPADPAGGEFVLAGDGVRYRIQSSSDLTSWLLEVTEVTGADAAAIQSMLPQLTPGWSYRTFRGSGAPASNPAEFLRVAIEESP